MVLVFEVVAIMRLPGTASSPGPTYCIGCDFDAIDSLSDGMSPSIE